MAKSKASKRRQRGNQNEAPEDQESNKDKGRVTTMATTQIPFKDMTKEQKEAKFEAYMLRQETNKGKNAAKRDATNKLKANHIDEFNGLLAAAQKEHNVDSSPVVEEDE